jgi:hypothetical protein
MWAPMGGPSAAFDRARGPPSAAVRPSTVRNVSTTAAGELREAFEGLAIGSSADESCSAWAVWRPEATSAVMTPTWRTLSAKGLQGIPEAGRP